MGGQRGRHGQDATGYVAGDTKNKDVTAPTLYQRIMASLATAKIIIEGFVIYKNVQVSFAYLRLVEILFHWGKKLKSIELKLYGHSLSTIYFDFS